jgi:hypothetical protein
MVDIGLYIGYGLLIVGMAAAVILPLMNALKSPKELAKSGMALGAMVIIFVISFGLSGSEVTPKYIAQGVGESSSKLIGAGLTMFYVVFFAAVIGIVYSEISKALK